MTEIKKKIVITTLGTSILTNCDRHYKKVENLELTDQEKAYLKQESKHETPARSKEYRERVSKWLDEKCKDKEGYEKASAEFNSLLKIWDEYKNLGYNKIETYLIGTDTVAAKIAGEFIRERINNSERKDKIEVKDLIVVPGLDVSSKGSFENGVDKLIYAIDQLIGDVIQCKDRNKRKKISESICFNVSGGYKGVIPIMTILAQLYECEITYIFQEYKKLIVISPMPINFDPILTESLYFDLLLRIDDKTNKPRYIDQLSKHGFYSKDKTEITALGRLFMKMVESNHPSASNVFGYYVEYRILKYLCEKKEEFEHSKIIKVPGKDPIELDFVFEKKDSAGRDIREVWEVKPITALFSDQNNPSKDSSIKKVYISKIIEQISKQIKYPDTNIGRYKVVFYSAFVAEKIKEKAKEKIAIFCDELRKKHTAVNFSVEILDLDKVIKDKGKDNPYKAVFSGEVTDKHFKVVEPFESR